MDNKQLNGVGLGVRLEYMDELLALPLSIDFLECAPENWMGVGGGRRKQFLKLLEHYPLVCHGLSLSIGALSPLNEPFVREVSDFLNAHGAVVYSEHLSYCSDDGYLYDLLPIPFTEGAVDHAVRRVQRVQEMLGRRVALENVSYYCAPGQEMEEIDFINAVIQQSGCELLLDVNNVYVNSINHGYDAKTFIDQLGDVTVPYFHVAGHNKRSQQLLVDTHGAAVTDSVWDLLAYAYQRFGPVPTLLERDFNMPCFDDLIEEVAQVRSCQNRMDIAA